MTDALRSSRSRWLAGGVVVAAVVALAVWDRARGAMPRDAVPVAIPEAGRWWASFASCAADPSPFPSRIQYYAGRRVPASWSAAGEPRPAFVAGWADPASGRVVLLPSLVGDSALVVHETWHIVHGRGHPVAVFGDGASVAPRCGIAAP